MMVHCRDCYAFFDNQSGIYLKCEACRDRDRNYVEAETMKQVPNLFEGLGDEE